MTELIAERRGRVLLLTIDGPTTRNALGPAVYAQGQEALMAAAVAPDIGAVVLTGAGGTFSSGGNLARLAELRDGTPDAAGQGVDLLHGLIRAVRRCGKPVVAAVEGAAAGAGFSLALACDLLIAAEDARFVLAHVRVGLSPDGGATAFLARMLPYQLAAEIALEGGVIGAERLQRAGVVNALCAPGTALETAIIRAQRLAEGPSVAMASIKGLLDVAYTGGPLYPHLDRERDTFVANLFRPAAGEGIAAFHAKRRPQFQTVD